MRPDRQRCGPGTDLAPLAVEHRTVPTAGLLSQWAAAPPDAGSAARPPHPRDPRSRRERPHPGVQDVASRTWAAPLRRAGGDGDRGGLVGTPLGSAERTPPTRTASRAHALRGRTVRKAAEGRFGHQREHPDQQEHEPLPGVRLAHPEARACRIASWSWTRCPVSSGEGCDLHPGGDQAVFLDAASVLPPIAFVGTVVFAYYLAKGLQPRAAGAVPGSWGRS